MATSGQVLVVSMSEVQLFNRCRKAWELGYVRDLEPIVTSEPVVKGSALHGELEAYAHDRRGTKAPVRESSDDMFEVAHEYLRRRGADDFDKMASIDLIEEPIYIPIAVPGWVTGINPNHPQVMLRTTFDLVYTKPTGWKVLRDYKSFDAAPSYDYDLDFQAKIYIASAMQHFQSTQVEFEFEYIRRCVPGTPRGRAPGAGKADTRERWQESECYIRMPLVISAQEAQRTWREAQQVIGQMLLTTHLSAEGSDAAFYHQALKAGPHSCQSCFYRHLCKADAQGTLDADFIQEYSNPRIKAPLPQNVLQTLTQK